MEHHRHPGRWLRHFISTPFIWMMIVPIAVLDLFLEIYHRVCFPLYGLPYVVRRNYFSFDRHKLQYLSAWDKLNCVYCSYANGLFMYAVAIAGETEKYWCGVKHASRPGYVAPPHHAGFADYGDHGAYASCKLRK